MGKVLALLLIILLALASAGGYLFLTEKIDAGEIKMADGQRLIEQQQPSLDEGKASLEAGKRELSEGKKKYEQAHDNPFLVLADKWLNGGKGFEKGRQQIAEGVKQVAKGEDKVKVGEEQLAAGKLNTQRGTELLRLGKNARVACALGAIFFTSLSIVLGFYWRRSLARIFMH
jgi:uncharacterized phage infection (PIP) family protein YhgE